VSPTDLPSTRRKRRPAAGATLATALLAALALAGCGSSHKSGTSADPAGVVPASASLYLGADVRPQGAEKSAAAAAGTALTRQANPYTRLIQALRTPGSNPLHYRLDVAPWLGPHAGAFVAAPAEAVALLPLLERLLVGSAAPVPFPYGAHGAQGALVLDTSDASAAQSFLDSQAAKAGAHAASYRGVAYKVTSGGVAFGLVQRFAVLGSEAGLHGVIDTALGGPSLVHQAPYTKLTAVAPAGVLAHLYVKPGGEAAAGASAEAAGTVALLAGGRAANISVVPASSSLTIYADASGAPSTHGSRGLLSASAEGSQALSELPGDAWLAVGLADVGTTLGGDIGALHAVASLAGLGGGSSSGSLSLGGLVEGLLSPLGVLAQAGARDPHDYTSWMGSGGIFASGSGLLELKGAVTIESKDPALSRAAVGKLGSLLSASGSSVKPTSIPGTDAAITVRVSGLPLALVIANGKDAAGGTKFVMGLGEPSVADALSPATTLASAQSRTTAAAALGEGIQPSLIFQVPTLLSILEGIGLTEDPSLRSVLPLLRGISSVAGGGHQLGEGVERLKLVIGLSSPPA
jgi:hypothetical protein